MRLLVILFLALAASAHAHDGNEPVVNRFVPQWQASCTTPAHTFRLTFVSEGGDPTEDDMVASIQWDGGAATRLQLDKALFVAGTLDTKAASQCDNLTAVLLPSGNLLVFLRRDDRPSVDRLLAVLLDGKTGRPLDAIADLGGEAIRATLVKNRLGVDVQLIKTWRNVSAHQEPTPVIAWARLHETHGKLVRQWTTPPR